MKGWGFPLPCFPSDDDGDHTGSVVAAAELLAGSIVTSN